MSGFRASDGAQLTFSDLGPTGGIPLVLVHGWQADRSIWNPLGAALARAHRVIAFDLRGSGESNAAPGPYQIETFASDLNDLIEAIDLDPAVVIGHSMGAKVAQRFAIDHPEAVEGLVLVAPIPAGAVRYAPSSKLSCGARSAILAHGPRGSSA